MELLWRDKSCRHFVHLAPVLAWHEDLLDLFKDIDHLLRLLGYPNSPGESRVVIRILSFTSHGWPFFSLPRCKARDYAWPTSLIYLHITTLRLVPILIRATFLRTPLHRWAQPRPNSTSTPLEVLLLKQTWTATHLYRSIFFPKPHQAKLL